MLAMLVHSLTPACVAWVCAMQLAHHAFTRRHVDALAIDTTTTLGSI